MHRLGDVGDQRRRDLNTVELLELGLDLARGLAAGVERDDLVIEPRQAALTLGHELRLKAAGAIPWDLDLELPGLTLHRLAALAVAAVAATAAFMGVARVAQV